MQALIFKKGRLSYQRQVPLPVVESGQALIRVKLAGICSTDLEIVKGYAGYEGILGHEFVGRVEEATDRSWIGKRVVGGINLGCGECVVCLSDGPEHCPKRTVLGIIGHDGAFADYLTLPISSLYEVPDQIADEEAVFTEPLAAALRVREQVIVRPSLKVAVLGPGRLGLLIALVLNMAGTHVIVLGRSSQSLTLPDQLGLETSLVDEETDNNYELVIEATGNEAGLIQALRLVQPLGTLVLKSTFAGEKAVDLTKIVVDEITVIGSRCGPFDPALRLLATGSLPVRTMIDGEFRLQDGILAFEIASRPGIRKILLRP